MKNDDADEEDNDDEDHGSDDGDEVKHSKEHQQAQQLLFRVGQKLLISNAKYNKLMSNVDHCTPLELPHEHAVALFVNKNSVKLADPRAPLGWVHESIAFHQITSNASASASHSASLNSISSSLTL